MEDPSTSSRSERRALVSKMTNLIPACIDRRLLPFKLHLLFSFGGLAGVLPNLILKYQQLGASVRMIGIMYSILPFVQFVSKPLAGAVADKLQRPKPVLMGAVALLAVSMFSINFIPPVAEPESTRTHLRAPFEFRCGPRGTDLVRCGQPFWVAVPATADGDLGAAWNVSCDLTVEVCDALDRIGVDGCNASRSSRWTLAVDLEGAESRAGLSEDCRAYPVAVLNSTSDTFFTTAIEDVVCLHPSNMSCLADTDVDRWRNVEDDGSQFAWIWTASILGYAAMGVVISMCDTVVLGILGQESRQQYFGRTRLFGSVGWGLFSVISGQLIDMASEGSDQMVFFPGFYLFIGLTLIDLLVLVPARVVTARRPPALLKKVCLAFQDPELVTFSLAIFVIGILTGVLWTFLVIYIRDMGGNQLLLGINYAVECFCFEIPCFFVSGWILRKVGHKRTMSLVLLVYAVRFVAYYFVSNPWLVLAIACTHGVTYGVFFACMATHAGAVAPPGVSATLQGVFQGIFEGAGLGIGALVGGMVYERFRGHVTFLVFGIVAFATCILYELANVAIARLKANPRPEKMGLQEIAKKDSSEAKY